MLNLYYHLSWSVFIASLFIFSFLTILPSTLMVSTYVSFELFSLSSSPLSLSFYLDFMSSSFIRVVLLIRTVIMTYSFNYMSPYSKSGFFLWLTFLFVVRMLLIVIISNLFFIILGWDGLGLVSFFLIVYYQNQSSITSGLFTLLINRLGDCFFLLSLSIILTSSWGQALWYSFYSTDMTILTVLLCFTFITKSAIFPFSPWLPLAMAAPTPISALVHSSTLVTSGLYLIMRYSHFILRVPNLAKFLIISRILTSFYAGLNSLVEQDLKKLIALSTLSHLGFISLSLSRGLITLSFFHLLTHAMFKSLLFMSIGDTMIRLSHSQDIRYLSSGSVLVPGSSSYLQISSLSLLGLPATRGFFSKDLILETLNFSNIRLILMFILYVNVGFTFFYTFQLIYFCFQPIKVSRYNLIHETQIIHSVLIRVIGVVRVTFGNTFLKYVLISTPLFSLPYEVKVLPLVILCLFAMTVGIVGSQCYNYAPHLHLYFSSMINLLHICIRAPSLFRLLLSSLLVKRVETGVFSFLANTSPLNLVLYISRQETLRKSRPAPFITLFYLFLLFFIIVWGVYNFSMLKFAICSPQCY